MSKLSVNTDKLTRIANDVDTLKKESERLTLMIEGVEKQLNYSGAPASFSKVRAALGGSRSGLGSITGKVGSYSNTLRNISRLYASAEKDICGTAAAGGSNKTTVTGETGLKAKPFEGKMGDLEKSAEEKLEEKGLRRKVVDKETYRDKDGNLYNADGKQIDKNGNLIKNGKKIDVKEYERKATLAEVSAGGTVSRSLVEEKYSYGEGNEISAKIGTASATATVAGGLYVIGKDGEKMFSPGVDAKVGVSATAMEAEWKHQWVGDKNLGINSDASVTAGKVEASAEATGQVFSKDGKLDVQLGAKGSAEAIAAKAEGKIGANVLGGEVSAKGGIQVGAGAHADVGYRDGVIKCDVGVAVGIGVSLDIEVDIGGAVNTVIGKSRSIFGFSGR